MRDARHVLNMTKLSYQNGNGQEVVRQKNLLAEAFASAS